MGTEHMRQWVIYAVHFIPLSNCFYQTINSLVLKEKRLNRISNAIFCLTAIFMFVVQPAAASECEMLDAAEVLQAEQTRLSSQVQNNSDNMSELLDTQLVYVRNSGVVDSKTSYLNSMRTGDTVYEFIEHTNDAVRIYGCVAILTGVGRYDVRIGQKPLKLMLRYHSIWHQQNGQLKLISWQATKMP